MNIRTFAPFTDKYPGPSSPDDPTPKPIGPPVDCPPKPEPVPVPFGGAHSSARSARSSEITVTVVCPEGDGVEIRRDPENPNIIGVECIKPGK